MTSGAHDQPSKAAVVLAFATVYVVWGSTYLAIAWTLETMPPFLMAGTRFLLAGALLLAWRLARGDAAPTARQWGWGAVIGGLLFLGGNGGVVWAEQRVPSGLTALVVGSVPAWIVLLDWARPGGRRPTALLAIGLVVGFGGVALLTWPAGGVPAVDAVAAAVLLLGSGCWAGGSLLARTADVPRSGHVATAVQMLGGGALLTLAGLATGETARVDLAATTWKSGGAFAYLVAFGSLAAFSCYAWLLRVTTPAKAATYAYVNPVVAVWLGVLAGERVPAQAWVAGALVVAGVALITQARSADGRR